MNLQTECGLFRLPRELRDLIYDLVFGTGIVDGRVQLPDGQSTVPQSALTVTCRRIKDEATALHQIA